MADAEELFCKHARKAADCELCQCTARRFVIERYQDVTQISGTGVILYGVEWFSGGPCDVYWLRTQTTGQYPSIDVVRSTHCYNDNAQVIYLDENRRSV